MYHKLFTHASADKHLVFPVWGYYKGMAMNILEQINIFIPLNNKKEWNF